MGNFWVIFIGIAIGTLLAEVFLYVVRKTKRRHDHPK